MTTIREAMCADLAALDESATINEAARCMKERDIGDVLVTQGDRLCGILTDRDIALRCVGEGRDAGVTTVGELCSRQLATISADSELESAIAMMRERAVRRIPVVEGERPIGVVSLGDLAIARDPRSALGDISSAAPSG